MISPPPPFISKSYTAFVDVDTQLLSIVCQGDFTVADIRDAGVWLVDVFQHEFGVQNLRGSVYDTRLVTSVEPGAMSEAAKTNKELQSLVDIDSFPTAYMTNRSQDAMLHAFFSAIQSNPARIICRSKKEALTFINSWNEKKGRVFDLSEELLMRWPQIPESL